MKKLTCAILFLFVFSMVVQATIHEKQSDGTNSKMRLKFSFMGTWIMLWQYCFNPYSPFTRTIYTGFVHHKRTESQYHLREMIARGDTPIKKDLTNED